MSKVVGIAPALRCQLSWNTRVNADELNFFLLRNKFAKFVATGVHNFWRNWCGELASCQYGDISYLLKQLSSYFPQKCFEIKTELYRYQWLRKLTEDDFWFLQKLPYTIYIPSKRTVIVHAGFVPGLPCDQQSLENLTHMRNIIQEDVFFGSRGLVGTSKIENGVPWASLWQGPEHVYFGHDARRGFQRWPHATGLDTGCLYGNNLTGVFIGSEDLPVSVSALDMYVSP
ncbi:hypothetical protein BaRGS_00020515 [Batillaria attramentaria]|uniref:Uncharacterized protein n=1 Tax=Batillaria attramentaria TaxID=370345 RepID=A0ABD0KMG0_9CAEN